MSGDINTVDRVVADSVAVAAAEDTQVMLVSAAVTSALAEQDPARLMAHPGAAATLLADRVLSVDSLHHPTDNRSSATAAAVDTRIVVLGDTKEDMDTVDVTVKG